MAKKVPDTPNDLSLLWNVLQKHIVPSITIISILIGAGYKVGSWVANNKAEMELGRMQTEWQIKLSDQRMQYESLLTKERQKATEQLVNVVFEYQKMQHEK